MQWLAPHCGVSGADNLNSDSQIRYTGRVDGEGWVSCPECGSYVEFKEDGTVTDYKGPVESEWWVQVDAALRKGGGA